MNNTFKDETTGLAFLIPYHRQLQRAEAAAMVERWMKQQKEQLFQDWKAKKQNQEWAGDENAKKDTLFNEFYEPRKSSEILLGVSSVDQETNE